MGSDTEKAPSNFMSGCGLGAGVVVGAIAVLLVICFGVAALSVWPGIQRRADAQRQGDRSAPAGSVDPTVDAEPPEPLPPLFAVKSVQFRPWTEGSTEAIGELTWNGPAQRVRGMKIDLYDDADTLIATETFYVKNVSPGAATTFRTFVTVDRDRVHSYRLSAD